MSILKKISLLSLTLLTAHGVNALVTFSSGQTARAVDFNNNFEELNTYVGSVDAGTPFMAAQVNGVNMQISGTSIGSEFGYTVVTPKHLSINVNTSGRLSYGGNDLLYASADCSGVPYIVLSDSYSREIDISKNVGDSYATPKLPGMFAAGERDGQLYYTLFDGIVKLNAKSQWSNGVCQTTAQTVIASEAKVNDASVTGLASYPLVITGAGQPLTVTAEIGSASPGAFDFSTPRNVFANGVKIGQTSPFFVYNLFSGISVVLDSHPGQTIALKQDGSYTGFGIMTPNNIYFVSNDCSGNAYFLSQSISSGQWNFSTSNSIGITIQNNGQYYSVDETLYKAAFGSRKSSSSNACVVTSTTGTSNVYKRLIPAAAPSLPTFTPPITVDGLTDIIVNDLPAAN